MFDDYKVGILKTHLNSMDEDPYYLTLVSGCKAKNINLDKGAIELLIKYYSGESNNRFVYQEGDIDFMKSYCEFCKHNLDGEPSVCKVYKNGKPVEILKTIEVCRSFEKE